VYHSIARSSSGGVGEAGKGGTSAGRGTSIRPNPIDPGLTSLAYLRRHYIISGRIKNTSDQEPLFRGRQWEVFSIKHTILGKRMAQSLRVQDKVPDHGWVSRSGGGKEGEGNE